MGPYSHSVSGSDRLDGSKDKQVGLRWPVALDRRVDELVLRANDAGARTTRRELVAALLLATDGSGEDLVDRVIKYRRALVRDAPLETPTAEVLEFPAQGPGPRSGR